jgi:hypothetical protein
LVGLAGLVNAAAASTGVPSVEGFDSGTRVVREIAEALTGKGRSILECYPWGSRAFLGLVSLFPEAARIALIEWGMRLSVGRAARVAALVDVDDLVRWCVDQYPDDRRYDMILVGSPNGAVAHLAALLDAPFLTTSFGLTFRHPTIQAADRTAYVESARAAIRSIRTANPDGGYELIAHYDPLHDRSLVEVAAFVRIKLTELPAAYVTFIERHLAPDGQLILIDCTYSWPQVTLGEGAFLQVGGLGAIASEEYLERWADDLQAFDRRESEWGCPEPFAGSVVQWARDRGIDFVEIRFDHPWSYSLLALNAYHACEGVRSELLMIDSFNHLNPRTNVETGIPALWLPFNTTEGPALVEAALQGTSIERILFAPLPSFADSPDTAPLDSWVDLLGRFGPVELLGVGPRLYPADPLAPFRFASRMAALREGLRLDRPLRLDIDRLATLITTYTMPPVP